MKDQSNQVSILRSSHMKFNLIFFLSFVLIMDKSKSKFEESKYSSSHIRRLRVWEAVEIRACVPVKTGRDITRWCASRVCPTAVTYSPGSICDSNLYIPHHQHQLPFCSHYLPPHRPTCTTCHLRLSNDQDDHHLQRCRGIYRDG